MDQFFSRNLPIREKRADTITSFYGGINDLIKLFESDTVDQRIRTFSQSAPDDLFTAIETLSKIKDAAVIIHGARGCSARFAADTFTTNSAAGKRWMVTNIDQRETILGSDSKLRQAITSIYQRFSPKLIFVVATPPVSINNDDIPAVVKELAEDLNVPIIPVLSSGFKSKSASYGYDETLFRIFKSLISEYKKSSTDIVNLISVNENPFDLAEAKRLLESIGLTINILPDDALVDNFQKAPSAKASIGLDLDKSNILGNALQKVYGVSCINTPRPIGLQFTKQWLNAIGNALGLEDEANKLHIREAQLSANLLHDLPLAGVRVYVSLDPANAFGVMSLIHQLGGEIAGVSISHIDRFHVASLKEYQVNSPALFIHVGHNQIFEEVNIVNKIQPDLYIGNNVSLGQIAQLGIASLYLPNIPILGYRGIHAFAKASRNALLNTAFAKRLKRISSSVYSEKWLNRSANWHIKQEVR